MKDSTIIPVDASGYPCTTEANITGYITWKKFVATYGKDNLEALPSTFGFDGAAFERKLTGLKADTDTPDPSNAVQVKFKFAHTYGTDSKNASVKYRMTIRKSFESEDGTSYAKGDTYTTDKYTYKAEYYELSDYYTDMQLTTTEVDANRVILDGANLYNKIGNDTFTITFGDDVAAFSGKSAANQKKVNLYYSLAPIEAIVDQYPEVDFTFLTFKGNPAPTFQNTGTMYFAAENKDYQVYKWDGEVLEPLTGKFEPTYKYIEVKNIKKLETYVIADQILEVEEEPEEPAEPVESTPTAEPDDDEGENPNTGAC